MIKVEVYYQIPILIGNKFRGYRFHTDSFDYESLESAIRFCDEITDSLINNEASETIIGFGLIISDEVKIELKENKKEDSTMSQETQVTKEVKVRTQFLTVGTSKKSGKTYLKTKFFGKDCIVNLINPDKKRIDPETFKGQSKVSVQYTSFATNEENGILALFGVTVVTNK